MAAVVTQVDLNFTFIHTLPVLFCTVSFSVDSSCIKFSHYNIKFPYLSPHLKLLMRAGVICIVLDMFIVCLCTEFCVLLTVVH